MGLQIRRTGADEYGRFIKALILGDPGSGKTLTSSTWPNPLYASAEGGLMSVADRGIPYTEVKTSDDLFKLRQTLDQEASVREQLLKIPVDTIVIDTIDEVQRILVRERLEGTKKEHLAIQDYGWLGDQMRAIIRGFRNLPMHVVFTCHLKKSEDSESGRVFYAPAIQGQVGDEIAQYFDLAVLLRGTVMTKIVGNESKRVQVKVMQTYPDPNYPWVKDRSGKLPSEIELDFDTDFKQLFESIYGDHEMSDSSDVVDVPDRAVAAARQQKIEENLASQGGAPAQAAATATADPPAPAPPEPPAKAAAKKATKKAAAAKKDAAPKAEAAPKEDAAPKDDPKDEPKAEPEAKPEPKPEPKAEEAPEAPEAAAEAPQEPEEAPEPETAAAEPEPVQEPLQGEPEPAQLEEPEGESDAEEAQPELAAEPEQATTVEEAAEAPGALVCEECGDPVENDDQADLSRIRFRKVLDRKCFKAAKAK